MSARGVSDHNAAAIVKRFLKYLKKTEYAPVNLNELCAALSVAERTLRSACEVEIGMGPIRYLTEQRMQLVRLALLSADPARKGVKKIALDHNFRQHGRFSVDYRKRFGEQPSETLRGRKADRRALAKASDYRR